MDHHVHKKLAYLPNEKCQTLKRPTPYAKLPFVYTSKRYIQSHWAAPAKGEYFGGYEVGRSMALAFLKHLANSNESFDSNHLLSIIDCQELRLQSAIDRHQCKDVGVSNWPTEPASLRGQRVGFINTIGEALLSSSKLLKPIFDMVSETEIVQYANHSLRRTDAELIKIAELEDKKNAA